MSDRLPNPSDSPPEPAGAEQRDELEKGIGSNPAEGLGGTAAKWSLAATFIGLVIGLIAGWLASRNYQIGNSAVVTTIIIGLIGAFAGGVYGFVNGGIARGKEDRRKEEGR